VWTGNPPHIGHFRRSDRRCTIAAVSRSEPPNLEPDWRATGAQRPFRPKTRELLDCRCPVVVPSSSVVSVSLRPVRRGRRLALPTSWGPHRANGRAPRHRELVAPGAPGKLPISVTAFLARIRTFGADDRRRAIWAPSAPSSGHAHA
jgi:hypothetical protein